MEKLHLDILDILAEHAKAAPETIAAMLGAEEEEVCKAIAWLERERIIAGYHTIIDWDRVRDDHAVALIEVRVSPQRDRGFDAIAQQIYRFPEVRAMYLMSGAYDLALFIEGVSMKEVAFFVANKLSPIESVLSTATHFVLKPYKVDGVAIEPNEEDMRLAVTF